MQNERQQESFANGKERPRDSSSSNNTSDKYSQAYFQERIEILRSGILQKIPNKDTLIPPKKNCVFIPILSSLDAAKQGLESIKTVEKSLLEEQKKHPEDNGWKDLSLLDPVYQALQETQATIDRLEEAATNAGCAIVKESGLLDYDDNDNNNDNGDINRDPDGGRNDNRGGSGTTRKTSSLLQMERDVLECTVLIQATPEKLAKWCAESPDVNRRLLDRFLGQETTDSPFMMAAFFEAGGPSHGNYGRALSIYDTLQNELRATNEMEPPSSLSAVTFLYHNSINTPFELKQRLALAVALELATPIPIFKQEDTFVDPLERFRYYAKFVSVHHSECSEKAENDELDEAFSTLSVWELRKVVNANATHDDLTWGRRFLRNYRPDQIYTTNQKWRYVMSVKTDVGYKHPDHSFSNYQELLSAGGECGPRAFFGRFISKAWGLPTWGVRQPGHAAMTRWTNDTSIGGWTVCLGAAWQFSWWEDDRYGGQTRHGPDFLEETQARTAAAATSSAGCWNRRRDLRNRLNNNSYYNKVVLLECLAEIQKETVEEDFSLEKFWRSLALAQRKMLARAFVYGAASAPCSISEQERAAIDDDHCETYSYTGSICSNKAPSKASSELQLLGHQKKMRHHKRTSIPIKKRRTSKSVSSESVQPRRQFRLVTSSLKPCRVDRVSIPHNPLRRHSDDDSLVVSMERATIREQASIESDGSIIIPAASFVDPKKPSKNVLVMKSFLGGEQLHLGHDGEIEYEMPSSVATGGTFALSAKVVNVHRDQKPLLVHIGNSSDYDDDENKDDDSFLYLQEQSIDGYEMIQLPQGQELEVPYTKGDWQETKSIRVDFGSGGRLKLSRNIPCHGLSIKEFILKPIGVKKL